MEKVLEAALSQKGLPIWGVCVLSCCLESPRMCTLCCRHYLLGGWGGEREILSEIPSFGTGRLQVKCEALPSFGARGCRTPPSPRTLRFLEALSLMVETLTAPGSDLLSLLLVEFPFLIHPSFQILLQRDIPLLLNLGKKLAKCGPLQGVFSPASLPPPPPMLNVIPSFLSAKASVSSKQEQELQR